MPATTPVIARLLWLRVGSLALGVCLGAGAIAGAWLPGALGAATWRLPATVVAWSRPGPAVAWPTTGEAAVAVPSLHARAASANETSVPIASLTKLMTIAVALRLAPLAPGATGSCLTVTDADVDNYDVDQSTDQSSVKVAVGEQLCESQLLAGLIVHSASNYAALLAQLLGYSQTAYVAQMNALAHSWGLAGTHYADVSGFNPDSVSTAADQLTVALRVYRYPIVQQLARLREVTLPVAGVVRSYTPLVGVDGVIGLKSGFTQAAGGCDAMVRASTFDHRRIVVLVVVLGQRGASDLETAGAVAEGLARDALNSIVQPVVRVGQTVGRLGWAGGATTLRVVRVTSPLQWREVTSGHVTVTISRDGQRLASVHAAASSTTWHGRLPVSSLSGLRVVVRRKDLLIVLAPTSALTRPPWWRGVL